MPTFQELKNMVNYDGAYQGREDMGLVKNWEFESEFQEPPETASVFRGQTIGANGELLYRVSHPIISFSEEATGSSRVSSSKGSVKSYGSSWSHR